MSEQPSQLDVQVAPTPTEQQLAVKPRAGVGLCLSGGGYRAMLYHLGALWRLNEAGWLPQLTRVASVSGGSITAGVLALGWRDLRFVDGVATNFEQVVAKPITRLARRTIDVPAVLLGLLTGGVSRRIAGAYDRHLFHGAKLGDLPDPAGGPLFLVLATDLSNGVLCEFTRDYVRNYASYKVAAPELALSLAVAASTAFPPFLSPVHFDLPNGRRVTLTDGGVYDNLGIEPVLKYVETIFVSDGGGPYDEQEQPKTDWLFGTIRVLLTILDKVGDLRRREVVKGLATKQRRGGLWAMSTDPDAYPRRAATLPVTRPETMLLATSETRLARVPTARLNQIVNWGYASADSCLRSYVDPDLPEPKGFPLPGGVGDPR